MMIMIFILGFSIPVIAKTNGYLENDGKMELQSDRLQTTKVEKEKKKIDQEKTVLDEKGIPLFTDQMEKQLKRNKQNEQKRLSDIKASLFTGKKAQDQTFQQTKAALFTKKVITMEKTTDDSKKTEEKTSSGKTIGGIIAGVVIVLISGIYFLGRGVWE